MVARPTDEKSESKLLKLDDRVVSALEAPAKGNRVYYDRGHKDAVAGFGCRVTAAGARSFILNYRTRGGQERRITIGSPPAWKAAAARRHAQELKRAIDQGKDPLKDIQEERDAPTMARLCQRFEDEYLPKKRPSTQRDYKAMIANEILPAMRALKVADVSYSDVDGLHRKITKRGVPYRANRVVALLSKMFSLAIKWQYRADNPAKGIERNQEDKRQRYLSMPEIQRLTKALAEHEDQQAANIIRLLLLTGARSEEVRAARWDQFDLEAGVWTKPAATTKQKKFHRVPLSAPAKQLLSEIRAAEEASAKKKERELSPYVFAGRLAGTFREGIKRPWDEISAAAAFDQHTRIHDLRHTFASILASSGASLPLIGALLGHTQPATTARYAHLFDDPLRAATDRVGALVDGRSAAQVVEFRGGRS